MENETDLETFLKSERKRNLKRFVGWMVILAVITVGVIGGMFWLFDSALGLFLG